MGLGVLGTLNTLPSLPDAPSPSGDDNPKLCLLVSRDPTTAFCNNGLADGENDESLACLPLGLSFLDKGDPTAPLLLLPGVPLLGVAERG